MSIMVDRDIAVSAINTFIKIPCSEKFIILFRYLCEVKEISNVEEAVQAVTANPFIIPDIVGITLDQLETKLNIYRVTDRFGKLITVF